ncbi:hypothetical protein H6F67_15260 [Microcoleus sp. FACHB-1515]|uniref:hypothetical protein n=1 Tax=Cyanophyceae TaxID=3028117 RepID=UPI001689D62B|nr:hypothetical protein [Microcoleus sp. FACHB-1515]MBD2091212.1 hypothetical protein [Microcoleus sp. FACHB-1515]
MQLFRAFMAGAIATVSTVAPLTTVNAVAIPPSGELIAQSQIRNFCRPEESMFVAAETRDYWVNICGGDLPNTYVGVNKRNGNAIRVPLRDYDRDSFEAVNGDTIYILARNTTRGSVLTVTQMPGYREILRQAVIRWN